MAKALTAKTLENLKPATTRLEVPDGLIRGLYFVMQPSGKSAWAVRYRVARQTRKLTLGFYPAIDLKAARELASKALVNVANGADPAADKQAAKNADKISDDRDQIEEVVAKFIERYAKANAARSWPETERILKREVLERWKGRKLSEVRRADVHDLLDAVVDRGSPIMANRVLAALRRMCSWAVERDIITRSPCDGVKAPSAERSRDRVLTDAELRSVWRACDPTGWPFGPLVRLLLLLGQRRDEVGAMRWSELDLETRTWVIPKERVKNGIEHVVPLSPTAAALLSSLPRILPPKGHPDFVFTTGGGRAVMGFSKAKERIDSFMLAEVGEGVPIPHWTFHDLRRTFASGCAKLGVNLPVIEKILNHTSGSFRGIVGVYQRHSFASEKRAAIEKWALHVENIATSNTDLTLSYLSGGAMGRDAK